MSTYMYQCESCKHTEERSEPMQINCPSCEEEMRELEEVSDREMECRNTKHNKFSPCPGCGA